MLLPTQKHSLIHQWPQRVAAVCAVVLQESCRMLLARVESSTILCPQVRDSRRVYLPALRRSPPKTTVSHPSSHCDFEDGSTPILPCLLVSILGAFIPQPMLKRLPVASLHSDCARFVWVPHQNKARHCWNLTIVVDKSCYRFYWGGECLRDSYNSPPACRLIRARFIWGI